MPPITAAQAKAIFDKLKKKTLPALEAELERRGTPVSHNTLKFWKRKNWQVRSRSATIDTAQASIIEARNTAKAALAAYVPPPEIAELETKLHAMTDGELIVYVTRSLLKNAEIMMERSKAVPDMMTNDPRGLAAVNLAASQMVGNAHALMAEARNLADRAMKDKALMFSPQAETKPQPGNRAFAGILERFGAVKPPVPVDREDEDDRPAIEIIPPTSRSVN